MSTIENKKTILKPLKRKAKIIMNKSLVFSCMISLCIIAITMSAQTKVSPDSLIARTIMTQDALSYQLVNDIFVVNDTTKECMLNLMICEVLLTEINFIDKPIGVFSYNNRITRRNIKKTLKKHFSHKNVRFFIKQLKSQPFELWNKQKITFINNNIVKLNKNAPDLKLSIPIFSISQKEAIITIHYGLYSANTVTLLCKMIEDKWHVHYKIMNVVYH